MATPKFKPCMQHQPMLFPPYCLQPPAGMSSPTEGGKGEGGFGGKAVGARSIPGSNREWGR